MNQNSDSSLEHKLLALLYAVRDTRDEVARTELNRLLRTDGNARSAMARLMVDEHAIIHHLRDESITSLLESVSKPLKVTPRASRWIAWRPLNAGAAGLLIGLFSASVVWAISGSVRSRLLLRESFEDIGFYWHNEFPTKLEQWGGDEAKVVSSEAGVIPKAGGRMLKLEPKMTEFSSRAHYVVDLQKQSRAFNSITRQIELRASFHPSVLDKKDRYVVRAAAFDEEIAGIDPLWMTHDWEDIQDHALAYAARGVSVPAGTDGWQTITLTIDVPPGSRILLISMWAATMDGKPDNRMAHYLDDVRLSSVIKEDLR